ISLIVGYALYWCISDYDYKKGRERCIVGKYKLDIHRTNLGIYKKKVEKYKGLILTFNADICTISNNKNYNYGEQGISV
uniref:hypothetical protein n=1 Tax=Prevotella sp. TaxID=59823 RepID=UPI00307B7D59